MNYLFLSTGFEEIEALTTVDLLRRANIQVTTVSCEESKMVLGSHRINVEADKQYKDCDFRDAEMLILRGTEGDLAVMAGHIPFVTAVVRGNCVILTAEGDRKEGTIEEGLLTVDKDRVTVLTSALDLNNA